MSDALLIVGHGSRDPSADDILPYYVERLSRSGSFSEVAACYLEKAPQIPDVVRQLHADRVFIMPMLLAQGYHTRVTIPEELGISMCESFASGREFILLEPLGRSEHIVTLIEERVALATKKDHS
ncbi:MAG TPA: CbiX/SirB N-terminal domain-containing protein [Methanocella sp.]|nr:CbiX/SirB N-terminal domain-containing protein [Methanocella sp.]